METTFSEQLGELRKAERALMRALSQIGSGRTPQGYPGIRIYEALQETRAAIRVLEGGRPPRRSYDRLARRTR